MRKFSAKSITTCLSFFLTLINLNAQCFKAISANEGHSIAIKTDGSLWAWGSNAYGRFGDGTTVSSNSPKQTGNDTNWASVSAGEYPTIAIKTDGTLWTWGRNIGGQLGIGTITLSNSPVQIGTANNWASISAGYHTVAIKNDGTLWAWGYNLYGQLGDGTTTDRNRPIQISGATNWASVSAGYNHTIAIKTDGTLWAWGVNYDGRLGDGTFTQRNSPVQIGTDTNWASVSGGLNHSIAVKTDGTLWGWGNNSNGQLGDGTVTNRNSPVQIGTATNWARISAGFYHTIAIRADGSLLAWGINYYGQIGDGTTTNKLVPTAIACPTTILPITLKNFTLTKVEKTVRLNWTCSAEINALEYVIERSNNGKDFDKIGTVGAKGIANEYSYTDLLTTNYTLPTTIYYRLRLVDKDGKYSYSEVKQLLIKNDKLEISIYPNPVKELINIISDKGITELRIVNTVGQEMIKQRVNGANIYQLSILNYKLNKGSYFIEIITNDGNRKIDKFIKE